jgi:hypothetical protein
MEAYYCHYGRIFFRFCKLSERQYINDVSEALRLTVERRPEQNKYNLLPSGDRMEEVSETSCVPHSDNGQRQKEIHTPNLLVTYITS